MNKQKGFTLIEVIVVMAVFLFVIGAAIIIFISIVQQQKRVLAEQQLLNQLSYAKEYMSKALRMAKAATTASDFTCLPPGYIYLLTRPYFDVDSGTTIYRGVKFINQSDSSALGTLVCQEFFLDDADPDRPVLKELKNNTNDFYAVGLTSNNMQMDVTNPIRFAINGQDGSVSGMGCTGNINECGATSDPGTPQPRISIILNVRIPSSGQEITRTVQTTVSQRNLNVK